MSQGNVEIVRNAFAAYSIGGIESALPFFSPDVVSYPDPEQAPLLDRVEKPPYRGHDGARTLDAMWAGAFDDYAWELHEIRDVQEGILVLAFLTGRSKEAGVPIRQRAGVVFSEFRDGMIGQVRYFLTWQQALEAAGLSE